MVSVQVKRCKIFNEFNREQQDQMFSFSIQKTLHHVDTLYYAVFLNEPEGVMKLQKQDDMPENFQQFIAMLRESKAALKLSPEAQIEFGDMHLATKAFANYEFCVSLEECFDIFIASYLPNEGTPRIVVQLRSRYLVLEGVINALEKSMSYLIDFLKPFGLVPVKVRENRIDYAFHTNLIQNPYKFFRDENLRKHLKTNLRIYQKIGKIGEDISVDTFNLGNRKSNNVYFRAYNKAREVIEMNYKAFFIERWYREGLISAFDKYVYEVAYELKSYRTGVLVGRLKWYLEHGTDENLKAECEKLLEKNYIKSDNCSQIEKKIRNVIPEPTLIFNIEYQTKRKFYATCGEWIENYSDLTPLPELVGKYEDGGLLKDVYLILGNARAIIDYLTGYGNVVSFVTDRTMSIKKFLQEGKPYMAWWKRIRGTPISYSFDTEIELYRHYDVNASIQKSRRLSLGNVARLAMLKNNDVGVRPYVEDLSDFLCVLNDNDMCNENGEVNDPRGYDAIRKRIARRTKGVLSVGEDLIPET